MLLLALWLLLALTAGYGHLPPAPSVQAASSTGSGLRFEPETNSYSGLTFTFDPRLEKRVEWLHFEHWLSIMQHSSALLYEALNGRAHLAEVRVLIPYKWRQFEWPVLHKPGVPIIMNRRLQFVDSDVIVGFDDFIYKDTPFALQHDECSKPGLNIHMPISFLEQNQPLDPKLKARLLVREFASHRYGLFKESGFRWDPMYPPFSALAGYSRSKHNSSSGASSLRKVQQQMMQQLLVDSANTASQPTTTTAATNQSQHELLAASVLGFDEHWTECNFDTSPANGLPLPQALNCAPYLTTRPSAGGATTTSEPVSFNLMSADPFAHTDLGPRVAAARQLSGQQPLPAEWRQLADSVRWHFCGENFPPTTMGASSQTNSASEQVANQQAPAAQQGRGNFAHNELASNKQNVMCNERSAMDVIRSHEDFRRAPFSPSTFNRLPATNFKFLQEMPPRLILCVEYSAHLYQSRRLEHGILEAAIGKFLAYDLIADTEMALVLFGQQHSTRTQFKRLDSSVDSRLTLYSPPLDPYDEQPRLYTEQELLQLDLQPTTASQAKLVKGTCSLAKALAEASASLQQRAQYDDVGADLVLLTSGLFIEDEQKIEDLLRAGGWSKNDNLQLNLIIYPAAMLFDTRSRDGLIALDGLESESVVRSRVNKLLLIQRLTGARLHLVREHLDANGNVKMSTLLQFYQIFEHLSKGHSWDQTHSMVMVGHKMVEPRNQGNGSRLSFQFQLDGSIQNELIVGFLDPKQHQLSRTGKRFALKNLQLRSPGGYLLLTDSHPWSTQQNGHHHHHQHELALNSDNQPLGALLNNEPITTTITLQQVSDPNGGSSRPDEQQQQDEQQLELDQQRPLAALASSAESALFPYRTQLSLAGFHLRASHLAQLNATHRLAGTWTLSATSDEPIQTDGLAMARVNPAGDTLTARCWIQTYNYSSDHQHLTDMPGGDSQLGANAQHHGPLKAVKVFVQTRAGPRMGPVQELDARMEVQDELGNIVQNVNMLDDGLGAPDMTHGDGIHSQYVMRAHRPGFYRVNVELSSGGGGGWRPSPSAGSGQSRAQGQDGPCCGSTIPASPNHLTPDTRHLSRQLYCGTFYAEPGNRLANQRPPRVNNITVVNVDQENRRVTIRWQEPSVDISSGLVFSSKQQLTAASTENESPSLVQELDSTIHAEPLVSGSRGTSRPSRRHLSSSRVSSSSNPEEIVAEEDDQINEQQSELQFETNDGQTGGPPRGLIVAGNQHHTSPQVPAANRYEIKLFTDRDALKRAFNARQEVGVRFTEWNVEGAFPNASAYGGTKEVTLRVPYGREGIYYIAMKVYNNLGRGSHLSHIVQFWLRNNLTLEEAESIYGQAGGTIDSEGNVYDKNGEMIHRSAGGGGAGPGGQLSYLLPRGPGSLDGISILVLISVLAFVFSVICISLVACLAGSARKSLTKRDPSDDKKAVATGSSMGLGAGSGSSMVSSGCGSSQQSEVASSAGSSQCGGHDVEINKLSMGGDELNYNNLQQQHLHQQHQAQLIQSQIIQEETTITSPRMSYLQQQQQLQYSDAIYHQHLGQFADVTDSSGGGKPKQWLQHTMINGYPYATVNGLAVGGGHDQTGAMIEGDLNQNGLGDSMSPVQSWPADILLSHYDKVKQARERNEIPPVMRIETLEHPDQFSEQGLPNVDDQKHQQQQQQQASHSPDQSYLVRQQPNQMPSYFNLQLQQQLNSVLKNKQRPLHLDGSSSPALDGVRDLHEQETHHNYQLDQQQQQIGPPPQYVYCASGLTDESGLMVSGRQQSMISEPSIYSQVTNLQQVSSGDQLLNAAGYYANQAWPPTTSNNLNATGHQGSHYSSASSAGSSHNNEQFGPGIHQQTRVKLINEDYATDNNKPNSAISEV